MEAFWFGFKAAIGAVAGLAALAAVVLIVLGLVGDWLARRR